MMTKRVAEMWGKNKTKLPSGLGVARKDLGEKNEKQNLIFFYFGSYKHPFYEHLLRVPLSGFSYVSSQVTQQPHWKASRLQIHDVVQGMMLRILCGLGIPKIRPLTIPSNVCAIHSAQYLLATSTPYAVDFEDVSAFTWYDGRMLQKPWTRWLLRLIFSSDSCRLILPWTHAARSSLINGLALHGRVLEKIHVVYPSYAAQQRLVDRSKHRMVSLLFVGKLFYEKGGLETIHAFLKLRDTSRVSGIQVTLTIVSRIPAAVKERFGSEKGLYLREGVSAKELDQLYRDADIFVMPSHYDTFGFVYLEAMSYGLPCVGTNQFATPEIIEDGKTGLLIHNPISRFDKRYIPLPITPASLKDLCRHPAEPYIDELVTALRRLVESKPTRLDMGRRGYEQIRSGKFSDRARSDILHSLYKKLADKE